MNKQYLEVIRPSGIIRTWIGVDTASARTDVTHELSLKVEILLIQSLHVMS